MSKREKVPVANHSITGSFGAEVSLALERWERNYHRLFGQPVPSLARIGVPQKPEGIAPVRLIVIAEELLDWTRGLPKQGTFNATSQHYPCWKYTNATLDEVVPEEFDERKLSELGTHAFWVRDMQEVDEDLAGKSADDIRELGIQTEGLLDRMLHEWDYFQEQDEHLDRQNWTLCSGSRRRRGRVPNVCWYDMFNVDWACVSDRVSSFRSRRVWM